MDLCGFVSGREERKVSVHYLITDTNHSGRESCKKGMSTAEVRNFVELRDRT